MKTPIFFVHLFFMIFFYQLSIFDILGSLDSFYSCDILRCSRILHSKINQPAHNSCLFFLISFNFFFNNINLVLPIVIISFPLILFYLFIFCLLYFLFSSFFFFFLLLISLSRWHVINLMKEKDTLILRVSLK